MDMSFPTGPGKEAIASAAGQAVALRGLTKAFDRQIRRRNGIAVALLPFESRAACWRPAFQAGLVTTRADL